MMFPTISAFQATITKPQPNEIWQRNQTSDAIIEWLQGDQPTIPEGFPTVLDLFYIKATTGERVERITTYNPSTNARWVFNPNDPISTNLTNGFYQILLVNSENTTDVAYSNQFMIRGGPFTGQREKWNDDFSSASTLSTITLVTAAMLSI